MAADNSPKTSDEPAAAATVTKQRKKRKWDQPAECLISAGVAIPGTIPLSMCGNVVPVPGMNPPIGSLAQSCNVSAVVPQQLVLPQSAAVIIQKLNQPKTQDELIAREIVINDADPMVRYKLTKSQTQEEIHKCTGAVVITRGKYRPPNGLPDVERPLYLHISAGAHLKEMGDRIKAVDRAATMIEEILKQGQNSSSTAGTQGSTLSTAHVFLGFDPDPSANITARIRGPNDQYINHIMTVTGVTATIKGRDSGCPDTSIDDQNKPLHIFISSNNTRSLEEAKRLAENLLDTICKECGASRVSCSNVYGAVPPPDELLTSVQNSSSELNIGPNLVNTLPYPTIPSSSPIGPYLQQMTASSMSVTKGTSYAGYEGIYPQATALQQVASVLRQTPFTTSHSTSTSTASSTPAITTSVKTGLNSSSESDRRPQRRKFQEMPAVASSPSTIQTGCKELADLNPGTTSHGSLGKASSLSPPVANGISLLHSKCLPQSSLSVSSMPSPPPRNASVSHSPLGSMPPPASTLSVPPRNMPPPPTKNIMPSSRNQKSLLATQTEHKDISAKMETVKQVPDTLLNLMDYGEEDDDEVPDGSKIELPKSLSTGTTVKPFWAV